MPENRLCSEPPADAADNVSAALSAALEAPSTGKTSSAQVGIAQSLATSVKQLFQRSQGVQLYQDGTFMLCTALLNGNITNAQFLDRHVALLTAVEKFVLEELQYIHKLRPDQPRYPPRLQITRWSSR